MVSPASGPVRHSLSASRNRLSSPPDAILLSGPAGAPGLVATVKLTASTARRARIGWRDLGGKHRALHLEGGELGHHRRVEAAGRLDARGAQRLRLRLVARGGVVAGGAPRGQIAVAGIERREPRAQRFGKIREVIRQDIVLARERANGKEPLLAGLEVERIEIERVERALRLAPGLVELDQRPRQGRERTVEPPLGLLCRALEPAQRIARRALGPVGPERLSGAGDLLAGALGALHEAAARVELGLLAGLRVERVELAHGVAQEILLGADIGERGLGLVEGGLGRRAFAPRGAHGLAPCLEPAEGVEHGAMRARVEQTAIVLLPVQLDKGGREPAQHLARDAAIVDPGGLAPVGGIDPAQDQIVLGGQPGLGQHVARGVVRRQLEHRHHLAPLSPRAHQIGPSAPAQHEAETIEQDRFARAGLSGEHVEARPEPEIEPVDDQHVANFKRTQHSQVPPGGGLPARP